MNHELTPEEKLSKLLDLYLYLKVGIYIVENTLCVWKGGGGGGVWLCPTSMAAGEKIKEKI